MSNQVLIKAICVLSFCVALQAAEMPPPALDQLVTAVEQAQQQNRSRLRPYRVTREYRLAGRDKPEKASRVIAEVNFQPPFSKTYNIREGDGSAAKLVRRLLETERQLSGSPEIEISRRNYDFRLAGTEHVEAQDCYILELVPKRRDKGLVEGRIWVDGQTFLIHRLEGKPAKSPSWWVRDTVFRMTFGPISGMWLQTSSEAQARVRLLGTRILTWRTVRYDAPELTAQSERLDPKTIPDKAALSLLPH